MDPVGPVGKLTGPEGPLGKSTGPEGPLGEHMRPKVPLERAQVLKVPDSVLETDSQGHPPVLAFVLPLSSVSCVAR